MTTISLTEVYDIIRSEKGILWVGAGLSQYAGYPSAQSLTKSIYKSLSSEQKKIIDENQTLENLCESYIKIKKDNRKSLFKVLDKQFGKKPKSVLYHEKLSKIPHISTIVTTNYDSLFELAYKNHIQVIANSNELSLVDKNLPNLFKIHGDLNHKQDIIISKSDYANFYNNLINNSFWTTIKERIINNHVIFIGYSLNDINIETILNSVSSELGPNRKKFIVIAPNILDYIAEDLRSKNIHYIDLKGEAFIDGLITNIKENIVKDKKAGKIGLDTLNKFMANHDFTADFLATSSGHVIGKIVSTDNMPKSGMLSIKGEQISPEQLKKFLTGRTFGELDLSQFESFSFSIAGINIWDKEDTLSLKLVSRPTIETTFDVEFANGVEFRTIPVKLYFSQYIYKIEVNLKEKLVEIEIDPVNQNCKFSVTHGPKYGFPKEELEIFNLLKYFTEGQSFTIFSKNGSSYPISETGGDEIMLRNVNKYVLYFEMLIAIEKHYKVRFSEIDKISDDIFTEIKILYETIDNKELFFDFDTSLEMTISQIDNLQMFENLNETAPNEISVVYTDYTLSIYGQEILFEERIYRLYDPFILNLEEFISGKTNKVQVISKSKKASEQFFFKRNNLQ